MALLIASHVSKAYPGLPVLHDVSFDVAAGEIVCLLGPSGCGKTTLLRIVAGLELPDRGQVMFAGQDLAGVPVHRRGFGLMFQDFALFPHKNVFENVAFGLRMQHRSAADVSTRVATVLALVQLAGYEGRRVTDLSGGEQQRVALARSLAPGPRLLMLDEPLGALDRTLREQVMNELRDILKRVGVTALYVTHDQQEAFAIADRIFVMRPDPAQGGRVEQAGTPQEVYRQPATPFVARFLGFQNLLPGSVLPRPQLQPPGQLAPGPAVIDRQHHGSTESGNAPDMVGGCLVDTALGPLWTSGASQPCAPGRAVLLLVRPEAAHVCPADATGPNIVAGRLQEQSFRGGFYQVRTVHAGGVELISTISTTDSALPESGEPIRLWLDPAAITVLEPATS